LKEFLIGFLITLLSNVNIYHVQHKIYPGILILGFVIPMMSLAIIKGLVFGNLKTRIHYSLGISLGGVVGVYLASNFYGM
jgi:hypothetical protein